MVLQKKGVTMRSNQVMQLEKKELTSTYNVSASETGCFRWTLSL